MNTKYTIIGDTHSKLNNLNKIDALFKKVEDLGNPCIWLGDMLDTKDIIQGQCLNNYLDNFNKSNLQHIVLVGNHDLFSLMGTKHSLEALKYLDNVTVIDEPSYSDDITLVPYNYNGHEICTWIERSSSPIFIGHLDIKGFDFGNGYYSKEGLDEKDFEKFELVISGHYHTRSERANIKYIGTPFSHDFGSSNTDHFIGTLDTTTKTLEWIPTNFARHMTYEINVDGQYELNLNPSDINRVILEGSVEKVKFTAELIKNRYPGVKVIQRISFEDEQYSILDKHDNVMAFRIWATTIKKLDPSVVDLGIKILKGDK